MEDNISLLLAFLLGISSSLHCIGMCGGIISALSIAHSGTGNAQGRAHAGLIFSYNLGRILSYCVAGFIVGTVATLSSFFASGTAYLLLQSIASLFLLALGFHIAGVFPQLKIIETVGMQAWQKLRPVAGKFIPADTLPRALVAGGIWGWLPCGLVYSVLLWTLSSANPLMGTLYMLFFGLGTLPAMIATGLFSSTVFSFATKGKFRVVAGVLIILLGMGSFYLNIQVLLAPSGEQQHMHHH